MGLELPTIYEGLNIEDVNTVNNNVTGNKISILQGTGLPGGNGSSQDSANIGSLYLRRDAEISNSQIYYKWISTNNQSDWKVLPSKDYVDKIIQTLSTGLIDGGMITINATNNTKFDVSAGIGIIVDNYTNPLTPTYQIVTWPAMIGVQSLYYNVSQRSFIAINSSGGIVQKSDKYTNQEYRENIVIGFLGHATFTSIINTRHSANAIFDASLRFTDFTNGIGAINLEGNVYSPNGANLKLNKTAGKIHRVGTSFHTNKKSPDIDESSTETNILFRYSHRLVTGFLVLGTVSDVNPNYWDNGSGTLQIVPPNFWTIQIIKYNSGSLAGTAGTRIEVGQELFPTKESALSVLPTPQHIHNPAFVDSTIRGYLIVKAGATALNNTNQAIFYEAGKYVEALNNPRVFETLQTTYDNSLNPEIITNSTNGSLNIKEGSGVGGSLLIGQDQNSNIVFNLDVSGNITTTGLFNTRNISADGLTIDNLVTEVNSIETSLGNTVNSNGTWLGFSGSNFLNPATSISNAFTILDSKLYTPVLVRHNGSVVQTFSTPTIILFNSLLMQDSIYTYSNGVVTIGFTASYRIVICLALDNTTNNRSTSETYVTVNGVELIASKLYGYHRDSSNGKTTISFAVNASLNAGDQVSVVARVFSGTGVLQTVPNSSRLTIQKSI